MKKIDKHNLDHSRGRRNESLMFPVFTAALAFFSDSSHACKEPRMISIIFTQSFHSACKFWKVLIRTEDLVQGIQEKLG